MFPDDLQKFIALLEAQGELRRIKVPVDPDLEAAVIIDRVCKTAGGSALLFEAIEGADMPLAANLYGSQRRVALALGVDTIGQLEMRLREDLMATGQKTSESALRNLAAEQQWQPVEDKNTACFAEKINANGLHALPSLRAWPLDGGRYLTLGQVFTMHPETRLANCGMYRVQVVDCETALLRCHPGSGGGEQIAAWHARGESAPVAIALGGPPVLTLVAGMPLPGEVDEVTFAGYLAGRSLSTTCCQNSELRVPTSSEVVIEGFVAPNDVQTEGPFGNHTGYYVPAALAPVLRVVKVWSRTNAICPGTVVGPPPMENAYLATATARLMLPLLQYDHPWVADVHLPIEGIYHRAAVVMVRDTDRSLEEIGADLRNSRVLLNSRLVVLVDENCRPDDVSRVYWRVVNAGDWLRKIRVSSQQLVIDARSKGSTTLKMCEKTKLRITNQWQQYDIDRK